MAKVRLGRTELFVERNAFGALPIQRVAMEEAVRLLRKAADGGIEYFDTARGYSDSEEKLGNAFGGRWQGLVIATKTPAKNAEDFRRDLQTSLRLLKTDRIDVYQFHNPSFCPKPGDGTGLYEEMLEARQQGKIRFIGITNHRLEVAKEAITSGLYDTLQFPLSYLSSEAETALVRLCKEADMGLIAMKALSGGLITNSAAACAWMAKTGGILPIWGIQRESELDEFLSYIPDAPTYDKAMAGIVEADREALKGDFCRGCGYCMPCPMGIQINMCARASLLMRRAPADMMLSDFGKEMMAKVPDCVECRQCVAKCPYGLDTPALLKRNYKDYMEVLSGKPL